MAMSATTANWHWKSKGVTPWARSWFETELPTVIFTTDDVTIGVSEASDVEGDVELGMRKSKLITIFDVRITMKWTATHANGARAAGSLTIPEVSHEVVVDGLHDYTYDWKLTKSTTEENEENEEVKDPSPKVLFELVKKHLPQRLTKFFETFPKAIVDTHGKDILTTPAASGQATPLNHSSATPAVTSSAVAAAASSSKTKKKLINTSTVRVEAQFMVSALDLFAYMTDEARIPQWTRAPAQSKPEPGGSFSFFGGGVVGKYISVEKPTGFVQSWKLKSPTWPDDYEGKLTTTLEEQSDSTKLLLELAGIPKGQEDELERNLMGYYINSLKSIGYVAFNISSATEVISHERRSVPVQPPKPFRLGGDEGSAPWWQVAFLGTVVAAVALWTALEYYPL